MYNPAMSEENVRRLYFLKLQRDRPMTKLLDEILNQYFEEKDKGFEERETLCTNVDSVETRPNRISYRKTFNDFW